MAKLILTTLGLLSLVSMSFLNGPRFYTGFIVRTLGHDGAIIIALSFITYVLGLIFLFFLTIPKFRRMLIFKRNISAVQVISVMAIVGYVFYGSYMLYSLSQSTDL